LLFTSIKNRRDYAAQPLVENKAAAFNDWSGGLADGLMDLTVASI
jgi:hypothetical protein